MTPRNPASKRICSGLWRLELALIAVALAILLAVSSIVRADGLWVSPGGISEHFGPGANHALNESHPGLIIGVERGHWHLEAGGFKNSDRLASRYVAGTRSWRLTGGDTAELRLHAGLALYDGQYLAEHVRAVVPAIFPALRSGRVEIAAAVVPPGLGVKTETGHDVGFVYLQARFWVLR